MASKRMFTQKIISADAFTKLPPTTQCLYFHLCMSADDDGFNNQIRRSMFNAHADQLDFEMLVRERFIIPFDNGVIVIKHWRMHNCIKNDRYHETEYIEEKSMLLLKKNGVYTEKNEYSSQLVADWNQNGTKMEPEIRLEEISIDKNSIEKKELDKSNSSVHSDKSEITDEDVFIWFPTNKKNEEYPVMKSYVSEMQELYPAVNVEQELRSMKAWLINNNKKTYKGMKRFIGGWLERSQNRGGSKNQSKIGVENDALQDFLNS